MRTYWIVSFTSTLLSMPLLLFVMGRYQMLSSLNMKIETLEEQSDDLFDEFASDEVLAISLGNQVSDMYRLMKDLQSSLAKSKRNMTMMNNKNKACQRLKKIRAAQLANQEKQLRKMRGAVKVESDAWKKEIQTLSAQLSANSPMCDYVKRNALSEKLCITTRG